VRRASNSRPPPMQSPERAYQPLASWVSGSFAPAPAAPSDAPEEKVLDADVLVDGKRVPIKLAYGEQHTVTTARGECNLYQYPTITRAGKTETLEEGAELEDLHASVKALCTQTESSKKDPAQIPDKVGAYLLHGLLIANTDDAVELVLDILKERPELLAQAHADGPFVGENFVHVLAVNQREDECKRLLEIAVQQAEAGKLDDTLISSLLTSVCEGVFFTSEPMRSYGGTPIAYLAAFRASTVLTYVLETPALSKFVRLNDLRCTVFGYTPLHAAIASGRKDTYDLLVEYGALETQTTYETTINQMPLTAIQLAGRLGHQQMLEHILMRRWQVQWKWGPVTQYKLPLEEIDSASHSLYDLMELVIMPDALPSTREMILDDFMGGFMFKLFQQKWAAGPVDEMKGRRICYLHWTFVAFDTLTLALLILMGFWIKEAPVHASRFVLPLATLVLLLLRVSFEVLKIGCGVVRHKGLSPNNRYKNTMLAISMLACVAVLLNPHAPDSAGTGDAWLWSLLSLATFLESFHVINSFFVPYQNMGMFALVVQKLLATDVQTFLVFFFLYLTSFWSSMYINYPRAGEGSLALVPEFNGAVKSFEAMVNLGIAGKKFDIDFWMPEVAQLNYGEYVSLVLFTFFYYYCMLLLVILLLRMLMAMLTATFNLVKQKAELEWRVQFARHILQLELIAMRLGFNTWSGEQIGAEWFYTFRAYRDIDDEKKSGDKAQERRTSAVPKETLHNPLTSASSQKSRTSIKVVKDPTSKNLLDA